MKNKIDYSCCPKCSSSVMVMAMQTGNVKIYGCIKCRNAQGAHLKMTDAKKAWKHYVDSFGDSQRTAPRGESK